MGSKMEEVGPGSIGVSGKLMVRLSRIGFRISAQWVQSNEQIFIMIESQDQGPRLILPPVSRIKKSVHYQPINQILSILNKKRHEYQTQLQKQEPSDQGYSLKYVRCETETNTIDRNPNNNKDLQEEFLARGSIIDQSFYRKTPRKRNRLIVLLSNSTLQHIKRSPPETSQPPQMSRYRSLQPKQRQPISRLDTSPKKKKTEREVINEQREESRLSHIKVPQFLLSKQDSSNMRLRTRTQAKSEVTTITPLKDVPTLPKQLVNMQKFKESILDLKRGGKTNQRLEAAVKSLQSFNPFFRKVQRVIGVSLLRLGKIKHKEAGTMLYQMQEEYSHFCIVLYGQVKISGRYGMHKLCETGQTLLQEVIMCPEGKQKPQVTFALQRAKTAEQSWILQVQKGDLHKLEVQLNKYGFRQALNQMKTIIKRNNIVKNWLRNKFKLLQKR